MIGSGTNPIFQLSDSLALDTARHTIQTDSIPKRVESAVTDTILQTDTLPAQTAIINDSLSDTYTTDSMGSTTTQPPLPENDETTTVIERPLSYNSPLPENERKEVVAEPHIFRTESNAQALHSNLLHTIGADTIGFFTGKNGLETGPVTATIKTIPGISGIPIPPSARTNDGVAAILLFCFFLSAFVLARTKRFLIQQFRNFISHRQRVSIFGTSTIVDVRYPILLILQTCILTGFGLFMLTSNLEPVLVDQYSPWMLIGIYILVFMIYLMIKWSIYSFLGWVFYDKNTTNSWLESYSTLIYFLGFILFPLVLLFVYFDPSPSMMITIGLILVIMTKIMMFYKWIKLFFNNMHGLLLLFLYFCALEIIPLFMLYEGAIRANNLLLIKF